MRWRDLSQSEQNSHSLNGFGGWLIPIFVIMLGLSVVFLLITTQEAATNWAIAEYGEAPGETFIQRFQLWAVFASVIWGLLLLMALRRSELFPNATLLCMWPLLLWSNALNIPLVGIRQTVIGFCLWAVVPVLISVYLVLSERVNVTYRRRARQSQTIQP